MAQHDAAGPDANRVGRRSDARDHNFRRCAREAGRCVMFRHPETMEPQLLGMLGEADCFRQRVGGGAALANGGLIQNAETNWI